MKATKEKRRGTKAKGRNTIVEVEVSAQQIVGNYNYLAVEYVGKKKSKSPT